MEGGVGRGGAGGGLGSMKMLSSTTGASCSDNLEEKESIAGLYAIFHMRNKRKPSPAARPRFFNRGYGMVGIWNM